MSKSKEQLKAGSKKGGTRFPNYSLRQVLSNLKELISKTQSKPITIEQLNAGVFKVRSKSADGMVKYSTLKQFGLAKGAYSKIESTPLASSIELSTEDEKLQYIQEAFFNVPTFKNTFETFQDSEVNKAKIKSYCVSSLNIHIDSSDKFVKSLLESCEVAKLVAINGEQIKFISGREVNLKDSKNDNGERDETFSDQHDDPENLTNGSERIPAENEKTEQKGAMKNRSSISTIELKIDPTLDPEKLEKQLSLLKKYGLI